MLHLIDKIHKNLLKLIYPSYCSGCQSLLLKNEIILCTHCLHNLPTTLHLDIQNNEIIKNFYGIIPIEFAASFLYFHQNGIAQNLIHELKYKKRQDIGIYLGELFGHQLLQSKHIKNIDYIIPVPIHKKRLHERGYNQVDTFCQTLSEICFLEYKKDLLLRTKYTKSQTKKSKQERSSIKSSLFSLSNNKKYEGSHFLLIDDVITTGATIEACAKELLSIPNSKVSILTIAYSQS